MDLLQYKPKAQFAQRHLLTLQDYTPDEILQVLSLAAKLKLQRKLGMDQTHILRGKNVALIFTKPSMRTRVSFEVGVQQLGAAGGARPDGLQGGEPVLYHVGQLPGYQGLGPSGHHHVGAGGHLHAGLGKFEEVVPVGRGRRLIVAVVVGLVLHRADHALFLIVAQQVGGDPQDPGHISDLVLHAFHIRSSPPLCRLGRHVRYLYLIVYLIFPLLPRKKGPP